MSVRLCLALLVAVVGGIAGAAENPLAGDLLVLRERRVRFVVRRDPGLASIPDPRSEDTALEITGSGPGDGATGPIALDSARWQSLGRRGYRYLDKSKQNGIRSIVLRGSRRGGTLIVVGGGPPWPYRITQPQQTIDVRLTIGDDVFCAKFDRYAANAPGRVRAVDADPPSSCAAGPASVCGDGTVEGREECDDGNTTGGDGCSADCTLESAAALCAGVPTSTGTGLRAVRIAADLQAPLYATSPPLDPNRLFIVEQGGRIRILRGGRLLRTPFLDIGTKILSGGERGLLSVAFHPDYETNGFFYVDYTRAPDGATVVARYHADPNSDQAEANSEQVLFTVAQPFSNHNGGLVVFGPDGRLWVGMGDGGGGGDPFNNAQNDGSRLGKLLRVDPNGGQPEIFAKGLRNPWRFSFDRVTGDLYIADVGQFLWEEIDVQRAPLLPGVNYGWHIMEGLHCYDPATACDQTGLTVPVLEYCHDQQDPECDAHPRGCSVTGGFVYRGCRLPGLHGRYFYGDYCSPFVRSFVGDGTDVRDHTAELAPGGGQKIDAISSFGEDARGELYVVDYGSGQARDGEVYAILPR